MYTLLAASCNPRIDVAKRESGLRLGRRSYIQFSTLPD
jgi:hypothetical protein